MYKKIKAFTLIELLVVIAIVGILSGFIIVSMSSSINAAKDAKIKSDIGTIAKALLVYAANNNSYPSGDTYPCTIGGGTTRCTTLESALTPYLTAIPKTPSNGFYTYSYSGTGPSFTLQSTLSTGYTYQYNSDSYFSTISYTSTCVSGGGLTCTETTDGAYVVNKYTLSGTSTGTTTWQTPVGVSQVEYLVVAGGGGGGAGKSGGGGGGGGAGGYLTANNFSVNGNLTVTVGAGGDGGNGDRGVSGYNSVFSTITATGGGAGGVGASGNMAGLNGGSGGGAGTQGGGSTISGGNGIAGQGYAGNGTTSGAPWPTGCGGGASAAGTNSSGGAGLSSSITGSSVCYAGGGGGGGSSLGGGNTNGRAASCGGGAGGNSGFIGNSGSANLGGGGGGGGATGSIFNGGAGGSGVVIIRYLHP